MPLELKQQRILPMTIGGTLYRYTVRPITKAEWLKYFASVSYEQKLVDGKIENTNENATARVELLEAVLLDAHGYEVEDGKAITELESWKQLLPTSHRFAFADLLFQCGPDATAPAKVMLGAEQTVLRARWTEEPGGKGVLTEYSGLKHIFSIPTVEQQRRYSRDSSRSMVTGGRNGKTQFLGAQSTLVDLYDQLIKRVEGYTVDGRPLEDLDTIIRNMDTLHKVQAMGAVFAPAEDATE